jgi:phosphoglycerate dehydrogenase-like enzyme
MKVLVPYSDELAKTIEAGLGSECTVVQSTRDVDSMIQNGGDATVVASTRVPGEYIRANKNLRLIQTFGAGVNGIDRDATLERNDVIVCNMHVNASEVAEYAIALLFTAAKNLVLNDRLMRKGDWSLGWGGPIYNIELRSRTCLIVGLGNVGSEIARRLRSFGMTLYGVTRSGSSKHSDLVDKMICVEDIFDAVKDADFVILSLPLTEDSSGLVDEHFLKRMKPSSILVNISRGKIVDEDALYRALKENWIRGAALDVWWRYPSSEERDSFYPSSLPFHELDNLVMSPHRAAYSESIETQQIQSVIKNILRFVHGEPLENIVDMELGY